MTTTQDELREQLAAIEHERWASWQEWMHSVCKQDTPGGDLVIPAELVKRWNRQIATPYAELSEDEKASDRNQVDRYWPLIADRERQAYKQGYIDGGIATLTNPKQQTGEK